MDCETQMEHRNEWKLSQDVKIQQPREHTPEIVAESKHVCVQKQASDFNRIFMNTQVFKKWERTN